MEHQEGFFKGVRDYDIFHQCWLPEGDPRAALLIVHGLGEHSSRYTNVVEYFVPLGYAVYALDHLGHGKSAGTRVYVDRFTDYTDTLHTYLRMVRDQLPQVPLFMFAHSMGGLIGAAYLLDHQDELDGAILSAPVVKISDTVSPVALTMSKVFSALLPKMGMLAVDAGGVSSDPRVVQAYRDDPLVHHGKVSARLGAEMLRAMQRVTAEAETIALPLLLIQGGADKLVDPQSAQMLYDLASSADKTLHVYEGFCHEMHNEPECATVLADIEDWLVAHVQA